MPIVYVHLIALPPQLLGRRQPARAGTDDADRLRALHARADRLHPAAREGSIRDEALDRADRDALIAFLDDAIALAQPVLRADAATYLGEVVGGGADLVRFLQPVLGGQFQPVRDVVVQRAVHRTERHAALAATAGLGARLLRREVAIDFGEVRAAFGHVALVRRLLLQADELQHPFGHSLPPTWRRGAPPDLRKLDIPATEGGWKGIWPTHVSMVDLFQRFPALQIPGTFLSTRELGPGWT